LTTLTIVASRHNSIESLDKIYGPELSTSVSKEDCEFNGQYYMNGQIFMDDCNYCGCAYKQVTCTAMLCHTREPG
ncbi:unnamed protein product, partial [Didymodactylos carnosus]